MIVRQVFQLSLIQMLLAGGLIASAPLAVAGHDEDFDPTEIEAPAHWEHELRIYHEWTEEQRDVKEDREDLRCKQYDGDIEDLCEDRAEEKYDS